MNGDKIPSAAARLARAAEEVELAERELDSALRDIEVMPREEKRAVTQVVTDAFQKLRDVRLALAELKEQVAALPLIGPIQQQKVDS